MNQTDIALEAIAVGKRYRRGWALQNCSFSLPAGTVVALVGPNGAGKSTLMKFPVQRSVLGKKCQSRVRPAMAGRITQYLDDARRRRENAGG